MPAELLVPIRKFQRLLDYMERIGLDGEAMLQPIGLSPEELARAPSDRRLPGTDYSRMYKNAVQQMQSLKWPIPWAAGIGSDAFEFMCQSIITCKTLGDALERAQRYDKLLYPLTNYRMWIKRGEDDFELHYKVTVQEQDNVFTPRNWDRKEHVQTVAKASGLVVWYSFCGWLIGRSIDLIRADIGSPSVSEAYRAGMDTVLHCPLEFDRKYNRIVAPANYLDYRLIHTSESLQKFLDNAVYGLIDINSKPGSTTAAIHSLIKLDLNTGMPSFEQMAENLHMSKSNLRRRLLKEETNYQKIKDQVRCELAVEHLRKEDTRINDLAELLGFTESSSFVRSFRNWVGVTPKAYRDSLRGGARV